MKNILGTFGPLVWKMGMDRILKINLKLYFVWRIIVFKFQKDQSNKTMWEKNKQTKTLNLQMKNNNNNIKQHNQKNFKFIWKDIKDLTPVRGQDGKISDTRGKDLYWSPNWLSFPRVSEISLISLSCTFSGVWFYFSLNLCFVYIHRAFSRKIVFRWWS